MSITIPGVLNVKSIQGRNGTFSVGDLRTEIGEFRIKDTLLDEFEPGQYTGRFVISQIFPQSYSWQGRVSIEVRAKLQEILLDNADVGSEPVVEPPEPDPLDEEAGSPSPRQSRHSRKKAVPAAPLATDASPQPGTDSNTSLFDPEVQALVDAGDMVKLDPAVDRNLFRRQRDQLKALGFTFNPASQSWTKE